MLRYNSSFSCSVSSSLLNSVSILVVRSTVSLYALVSIPKYEISISYTSQNLFKVESVSALFPLSILDMAGLDSPTLSATSDCRQPREFLRSFSLWPICLLFIIISPFRYYISICYFWKTIHSNCNSIESNRYLMEKC